MGITLSKGKTCVPAHRKTADDGPLNSSLVEQLQNVVRHRIDGRLIITHRRLAKSAQVGCNHLAIQARNDFVPHRMVERIAVQQDQRRLHRTKFIAVRVCWLSERWAAGFVLTRSSRRFWQEWRAKSEIRNPKSETNSNEQRSKSSKPSRRGRADWSGFEDLSFEFGACFGFRVSDFGFVLAG